MTLLKDARVEVIRAAAQAKINSDAEAKIEWEYRRKFLDDQAEMFQKRKPIPPAKSVFVSFSKRTGGQYFSLLQAKLNDHGFIVNHGFNPVAGDEGYVLKRVLGQINSSTLYVGILTKEMRVISNDGEEKWAPSVWLVEEKGMALASNKPFAFMIERGLSQEFWKNINNLAQTEFDYLDFLPQSDEVLRILEEKYEAKIKEYMPRDRF
jgi:hypothetical protein